MDQQPAVAPGESDARFAARRTEYVQSLGRGLAVIRSFSHDAPSMTLSEVAERTGLTRAAARRFLLTLEELGYVGFSGREFFLRPRILDLGYAYLSSHGLWDIAQPLMDRLSERLQEACSASVLDGDESVITALVRRRMLPLSLRIGDRLPIHASSAGRVVLAFAPPSVIERYLETATFRQVTGHTVTDRDVLRSRLREVRDSGYAIGDQEVEEGVRSISVPIEGRHARVVAALTIAGHRDRLTEADLFQRVLPDVLRTAEEIGQAIRQTGNRVGS